MKKIPILISVALLTIFSMTGCGEKEKTVSLEFENGVLKWEQVKEAVSYEVDIGNGGKVTQETSYDLSDVIEVDGEYNVAVRYVTSDGEHKDLGYKNLKAEVLDEPAVHTQKINKDYYYVWSDVENADSYSYDAHDGKGYQIAKADENGLYKVLVTNTSEQLITVVANGSYKGNVLYLSNETMYTYKDECMFDMGLLSNYQNVFTSEGDLEESIKIGSTLEKGVYDMEISLYVMDSNGNRVTGNGTWGRRLVGNDNSLYWFCEKELDIFENSGNTIPDPDEMYTTKIQLKVDRGGNVIVGFGDFLRGEKVVIASITYNGKNIISADGGKEKPVEEVEKLDLSSVKDYIAMYTAPGGWYDENPHEDYEIKIPTKMKDGLGSVKITYQVCAGDGSMLEGNGMWGRRIAGADVKGGPWEWLNEYQAGDFKPVELPKPTETREAKISVMVEKGYFTLTAMDFDQGEIIIIKDVQEATAPEGNGIFVSNGDVIQTLKVKTTLTGKPRHTNVTLEVSYRMYDAFGETLEGNGIWGRRFGAASKTLWVCEDAIEGTPEAKGTVPDANKVVKDKFMFSEVNKYGVITFNVYDFNAGEIIEITSIKYNGKEVMVKK